MGDLFLAPNVKISTNGVTPAGAGTQLLLPAYTGVMYPTCQLYSSVAASSALTNTTTETVLDSFTLPADTLKAGTTVRIRGWGIATATNSTDTLIVKVYVGGTGGTAILAIPASAVDAVNDDIWSFDCYVACRTAGASGTAVAFARGEITLAGEFAAAGTVVTDTTASFTVNTTTTQQLAVAATWSVASTSNSCRNDMFIVDIAG